MKNCKAPLQNIPIQTEMGREIKAAFVKDSSALLSALLNVDYSSIERRLSSMLPNSFAGEDGQRERDDDESDEVGHGTSEVR